MDDKLPSVPQINKEGVFGKEVLNFLKGSLHFRSPLEFSPFTGTLGKWFHDMNTMWIHFFVEIHHAH